MNLNILTAITAIVLFSACTKKDNTGTDTNPGTNSPDTNTYIVNGIADFTVKQDESHILALTIEHEKGEQQQVTLSSKDLPPGVYIDYSTQKGTPTFASVLTIYADYSTPVGNHTITITASGSKSNTTKEYPLTMNVTQGPPCITKLTGQYNVTYTGNTTYNKATTFCRIEDNGGNKMYIGIFPTLASWYRAAATYNCDTKTINILPQQDTESDSIKGTGTFTTKFNDIDIHLIRKKAHAAAWTDTFNFKLNR